MSKHMTAKFTPGPWQYLDEWVTHPVVTSSNFSIEVRGPNEKHDARLIAAAPELLAALQDLIGGTQHCGEMSWCGEPALSPWERARAAIAAATGEQA